jgi:hypothetical protein
MAVITFDTARTITSQACEWMKSVSDYVKDPVGSPAPADIYKTQKLAFEINIAELQSIINESSKIVGILGYDEAGSLTVIFVGTDTGYTPQANVLPVQTWPKLYGLGELDNVLTKYLTP